LRVLAPVFRFCRNIADIERVSSMLPIPAEMHRSSNFPMERQNGHQETKEHRQEKYQEGVCGGKKAADHRTSAQISANSTR